MGLTLAVILIISTSLAGLVFAKISGDILQKYLSFFISFATGVFSITVFFLLREVFEESWTKSLAIVVAGVLLLWLIERVSPESHHHHIMDDSKCRKRKPIKPAKILMGDALHNIGDGVMLVPAFAISVGYGFAVAFAIAIHELVQQLSEFFLLKGAGLTTKQATLRSVIAQSSLVVGVLLSLFMSKTDTFASFATSLATGGFIYIVSADLIPHMKENIKTDKKPILHAIAFSAGILIMLIIATLAHQHE